MQALKIFESYADSLRAAKNLRRESRRIAVTFSAVIALLVASTACGQQESPRPQSHGAPALSSRPSSQPSSASKMPVEFVKRLRSLGLKDSETRERLSDTDLDASSSFLQPERRHELQYETEETEGDANLAEEEQHAGDRSSVQQAVFRSSPNDAAVMSQPVYAEIETAEVTAAPEAFLDLTLDTQSPAPAGRSPEATHRSVEISANSSPLQVLMRAVAWIVIALCSCCLIILGLRRWQRQRGLLPTTNSRSRVVETLSLGPGRTVSLIELAGFRALVASDTGGIRTLILAPTSFQDELLQAEHATPPGNAIRQ